MDTPDALALVARLRELFQSGVTLRAAAKAIGKPVTTTWDLAQRYRIPRRRRALTARKRRTLERAIESAKLTLSGISRRLRIAKSTVCRHQQRILKRESKATFWPKRLRAPRRCERGHLTRFWPCVICAAAGPGK